MTNSIDDLHVYLRSIAEGERTSLSVLAGLVHEGAQVLDLGCGSGALGQYLKETRHCTSDGVTWSQAEAEHARPHYRHVHVANLESADLLTLLASQRYDYIVCADVLEHLSHPEAVLDQCRQLLSERGRLLISVPNAAYSGLLAELMEGEFRYRDEGLLDRTHLRFFTRRSLTRFMSESRWQLESLDTITRQLPDSEFQVAFDSLPPTVARHLLSADDALSYQFIGCAYPVAHAPPLDLPAESTEPAHARFTAQLYLDYGDGYSESGKLSHSAIIGAERQTLTFNVPAAHLPLTRLKLDPADRPGFLHLFRITLRDPHGTPVWQWAAHDGLPSLFENTPSHEMVWQAPLSPAHGSSLLLSGTDPWLELPISTDRYAQLVGGVARLEVEMGWPMSADYLALSLNVHALTDQVARLEHQERDLRSHLAQQSTVLNHTEVRAALLEESSQALSRERATLRQETQRLQKDYASLASHLKSIENSTVFRASRPLVHMKMKLDQLLGRQPRSTAPATVSAQALMPTNHPVDIIVPVYRGLADTQLCIESALKSPCQTPWRLIVINDASPELEVTEWLRTRAAQDQRITLLENPENLGFVGTVNRGMALSTTNDVLLLNSDTEVANNWLDRIRNAAYSDQKVASVTPFSNNATICSYPQFCKDNELPQGLDTAQIDLLCAATNAGAVVDVPTGVGFCMYIRRDCLDAIGLFDTENFGKGYGEENDFCQRAQAAGWRNLHVLDTFVLHTGGVSFGESKSPREQAAMETLRRLHPLYESAVTRFVMDDPARPYRMAMDAARIQQSPLPVVLAVLHDRAGGTLRHVQELAHSLRGQCLFLTLRPASGKSVVLQLAHESEGLELVFRLEDQYPELLTVLRQFRVGHVHFHHLLGHDAIITELPAQLGVNYDFTAHDFFSFCTRITLTGKDNRYAEESRSGTCACCAPQDPSPMGTGTVADWRHRNCHFLTAARYVFCPSHDTARRLASFAPGARLQVVPHTDLDAVPNVDPAPPAPRQADVPFKVAVLGALSAIKGADVLEQTALEAARRGLSIEFHLLGFGYRHLQTQPRAHLTVHGEYRDAELSALLKWLKPDVVWFPAQWPETYSYTLSAALQAGLPVVVPNIGAFAERIERRPCSWVEPWDNSPARWLEFFASLQHQSAGEWVAPQTSAVACLSPTEATFWSYEMQYVVNTGSSGKPPLQPALDAVALSRYLAQPSKSTAARSGVLRALAYLRSHPAMRGVAQMIPAQLQRNVKTWLQR